MSRGRGTLRIALGVLVLALALAPVGPAAAQPVEWEPVNNGLYGGLVQSLGVSPGYATDGTLFAGTRGGGVFRSTDGGDTWTEVNTGLTSTDVKSLGVSPGYATDGTLFAGTRGGGVFRGLAATPGPAAGRRSGGGGWPRWRRPWQRWRGLPGAEGRRVRPPVHDSTAV